MDKAEYPAIGEHGCSNFVPLCTKVSLALASPFSEEPGCADSSSDILTEPQKWGETSEPVEFLVQETPSFPKLSGQHRSPSMAKTLWTLSSRIPPVRSFVEELCQGYFDLIWKIMLNSVSACHLRNTYLLRLELTKHNNEIKITDQIFLSPVVPKFLLLPSKRQHLNSPHYPIAGAELSSLCHVIQSGIVTAWFEQPLTNAHSLGCWPRGEPESWTCLDMFIKDYTKSMRTRLSSN